MTSYDPNTFRAVVIASALELYAKTGMKANTAYTPKNMLATAGQITGVAYKRGAYMQAAQDLRAWANARKHIMA